MFFILNVILISRDTYADIYTDTKTHAHKHTLDANVIYNLKLQLFPQIKALSYSHAENSKQLTSTSYPRALDSNSTKHHSTINSQD